MAKQAGLKVMVPFEIILNGGFQFMALYSWFLGSIPWQFAAYLSTVGLLVHLILLGYRAISLLIGFLNDVEPMIAVSDQILRELSVKQSGKPG